MLMKNAVTALLGLAAAAEAFSVHTHKPSRALERRQNRGGNRNGGNNNAGNNNAGNNAGNAAAASATCLAANAVQTGSQSTGQNGAVAADGQVNSATDNANFINLCSGSTLTNGLQNRDGSCNGIPMGKIPAVNKMVSAVILNPKNGDDLTPLTSFNIQVNVANMQLGSFTNATSTYYAAPQDVNGAGIIIGHTHVTVQDTGNTLNPTQPLDATQFAFFKGINDAGNGKGLLSTAVAGGLPAGCYRVCTMTSASNHQPVLMPVAQRGSQEDCRYFSVGGACGNGGNANAGNNAGNNAGAATGNGKNTGNNANAGAAASATQASASAAASATAGAATGNGKNTGKGKNTGNGQNNAGAATGNGKNTGNNANAGAAVSATQASTSAAASATAGAATGNGKKTGKGQNNAGAGAAASATKASASAAASATKASTSAAASATAKAQTGGAKANTGAAAAAGAAIGGAAAPAVESNGDANRPFKVNGNTFATKAAAVQRACAIQNNACADAVNSGQAKGSSVGDCNAQETACRAAGGA